MLVYEGMCYVCAIIACLLSIQTTYQVSVLPLSLQITTQDQEITISLHMGRLRSREDK